MRFEFYRLRFNFTAQDTIRFPRGKPANVLRGAFGSIFRRIACAPHCTDAAACEIRESCAYARTFEPASTGAGPSGLADWPRPFVFRAAHLDGQIIQPQSPFHFDVNLFQPDRSVIGYFVQAFAQLAQDGLGWKRGRATLNTVDEITSAVDLSPERDSIARVAVRFVTPTELKSGQQIAARPEFGILMARIRDRISTLRALYGAGPLDMDFAGFGHRADAVRMIFCDVAQVRARRVSARTGQQHGLDGFIGMAEYEGELGEFVPFLRAARYSGVGRQTTWGKGELEVIETRSTE
jgi:hypothetical protein